MTLVPFTFQAPSEAESVAIAGSFNNWDPSAHQMSKQRDGSWSIDVTLPEDQSKVFYKFVVNGKEWVLDNDKEKELDQSGFVNNVFLNESKQLVLSNTVKDNSTRSDSDMNLKAGPLSPTSQKKKFGGIFNCLWFKKSE